MRLNSSLYCKYNKPVNYIIRVVSVVLRYCDKKKRDVNDCVIFNDNVSLSSWIHLECV